MRRDERPARAKARLAPARARRERERPAPEPRAAHPETRSVEMHARGHQHPPPAARSLAVKADTVSPSPATTVRQGEVRTISKARASRRSRGLTSATRESPEQLEKAEPRESDTATVTSIS